MYSEDEIDDGFDGPEIDAELVVPVATAAAAATTAVEEAAMREHVTATTAAALKPLPKDLSMRALLDAMMCPRPQDSRWHHIIGRAS